MSLLFTCILASLEEGLSVRPSDHPSIMPSFRKKSFSRAYHASSNHAIKRSCHYAIIPSSNHVIMQSFDHADIQEDALLPLWALSFIWAMTSLISLHWNQLTNWPTDELTDVSIDRGNIYQFCIPRNRERRKFSFPGIEGAQMERR